VSEIATCTAVRDAVSADLDGEDVGLPAAAVRTHLSGCAGCQRYADALPRVNRRVTVAGAERIPDLTAPILVALAADRAGERGRRTRDLRVLVALAGAVQLVLAVPVLLGLAGPAAHLGRDLGAFELALGAGLLLAAWQPRRAAGVLPIAAVVAVAATLAGLVDLAAGRATVLAELTHLTELLGVAALWALTRRVPAATVPQPAVAGPGGTMRGA
jgi:predicted anti-sigma-YlaC factor YlaD